MKIDQDDFDDWLAHPLTEIMMRCLERWEIEAREHWVTTSWEGGNADPVLLARMRERAKTLAQVREISRETILETMERR